MAYAALGLLALHEVETSQTARRLVAGTRKVVQQVVVEIVYPALFKLLVEYALLIPFLFQEDNRQFRRERERVAAVTLHQSLTRHTLALEVVVHVCRVEICESALDEGIHHTLHLCHIHR